jgi:hypothetical protein
VVALAGLGAAAQHIVDGDTVKKHYDDNRDLLKHFLDIGSHRRAQRSQGLTLLRRTVPHDEPRPCAQQVNRHVAEDWLENQGVDGAAELLGIKPTTLISRMEKMGLKRPD